MREIPIRWDILQLAIKLPAEAVKRATQFFRVAVKFLQHAPAVETSIGVALQLSRLGPNHQKRHARNVVTIMIAWIRNVLFAASELPYLFPE